MEAKIFNCVDNDDVEGLIILMDYPNVFEIEDSSGLTILQRAIVNKRFAVFDYLLSLDDCPINACNSEGKTALEIALYNRKELFINSLIKKGADIADIADIYYDNDGSPLLLHSALHSNDVEVAKLIIEKGGYLNSQDEYGRTPLHLVIELSRFYDGWDELLAMMLHFGADPSITDDTNHKAIDFVFSSDWLSESVQEILVFYCFDDYCTDYDISIDNLFGLLKSNYSFTPQVLKHVTTVNLDNIPYYECLETYFKTLFIIKPEYLKLLLEKFDYVIQYLIESPLDEDDAIEYVYWKDVSTENFDLLFESRFSSDVIQIINNTRINIFMHVALDLDVPQSKLLELIMVLLSYGANINNLDLQHIYGIFGDGEFFRILLHMDIKISDDENQKCEIMPALLYNISMDIETFLSNPRKFKCSSKALEELFSYFAHPKLKSYCRSESNDIYDKVKDLPSVPLLVELARNQVRKFLIQKYKIKNCMQFYTLIKHLPISKVHQKIITLETKLY